MALWNYYFLITFKFTIYPGLSIFELLMKYFVFIFIAAALFFANPSLAQGSQASTGSSSIFTPKEGKSNKKSQVKRSKKTYKASSGRNKAGLFARKKKSDCDCPGSPKAKRKKRR